MADLFDSKRKAGVEAINEGDFGNLFEWLKEKGRIEQLKQALGKEETPSPIFLKHHHPPALHKDPGPYTVVVLGDAHDDPRLDKHRFFYMGRYIRQVEPDAVVQIGDFATLDSMCKYPPVSFNEMYGRPITITEDLESFNNALQALKEGMGDFEPPYGKAVTLGNHEARMFSGAIRAQEQRAGFGDLAFSSYCKLLQAYGWTITDYGDFIFLGGVGFTHAPFTKMGRPYGGKTAERQVASASRFDIVMGHSHEHKVATEPKIGGDWNRVINAGCTLPEGYVENYAKHSNHGWSHGVLRVHIRDGHIKDYNWTTMEVLEANYGDG